MKIWRNIYSILLGEMDENMTFQGVHIGSADPCHSMHSVLTTQGRVLDPYMELCFGFQSKPDSHKISGSLSLEEPSRRSFGFNRCEFEEQRSWSLEGSSSHFSSQYSYSQCL